MPVRDITDVARLKKINAALISRVERSMDQQGNAFSLFQTAINLEGRVRSRTEELRATLRRLEESNVDLLAAKETAEQANLSKTRFLAAASHDVLQPLNAAHLSVSALADIQTTVEGRALVGQVVRSLETMEDLLRTLLDISKLDAGVVTPEYSEVAIDPLFQSLRSDFQPLADKKRLKLRFRASSAMIRSDRTLLRRILQNIISNAIRYTRQGGVLVSVRNRRATARIDVWDTGCGIPEDQREKVFEEFHRGVHTEAGPAGAGLGLGLAIVRRMASALGYRVTFTTRAGMGTIFHIDMPPGSFVTSKAQAVSADPEPVRGYGLFGTKVLLVENDPNTMRGMATLLERWRCSARFASTTRQALDELGDTDWVPDIVIADQHLDEDDLGTNTIAEVRTYLARQVPALIVTADTSEALAATARAAGVELMRKPVKPAQLRALLAHFLA